MKENMAAMQKELAAMEITGEAGGGMVNVVMGGDHQVRRINIDDALWQEQDKGLLEDLIAAACNQAALKLKEVSSEKQKGLMAGMPLPPGFSL